MEGGADRLGGGYRVKSIRQVRNYLYMVQLVFMVGITGYLIWSSGLASLKPFYLPINTFVYLLLVSGIIFAVEGMVFRTLTMKFTPNKSSRYYMSKKSVDEALMIMVVALIIGLLLFLPYFPNALENTMTGDVIIGNTHEFIDRDALGLTIISSVTFTPHNGEPDVYIVSDVYYQQYQGNMEMLSVYRMNAQTKVNETFTVPLPDDQYTVYHIVVDGDASDSAHATLTRSASQTFLDYFPFFMFLFVAIYGVWLVYLLPIRKQYAKDAIYK